MDEQGVVVPEMARAEFKLLGPEYAHMRGALDMAESSRVMLFFDLPMYENEISTDVFENRKKTCLLGVRALKTRLQVLPLALKIPRHLRRIL